MLRSLRLFVLCVHQTPPPAKLLKLLDDATSSSDKISDPEVISSTAADTACNALVNIHSTRAGTQGLPQ